MKFCAWRVWAKIREYLATHVKSGLLLMLLIEEAPNFAASYSGMVQYSSALDVECSRKLDVLKWEQAECFAGSWHSLEAFMLAARGLS